MMAHAAVVLGRSLIPVGLHQDLSVDCIRSPYGPPHTMADIKARPRPRPCVIEAWEAHEPELRGWLRGRLHGDEALAEDILQTLFLKAIRQGQRFCEVKQARAWLFASARNALIDDARLRKKNVPVPESLTEHSEPVRPVDSLAQCLPRALSEIPASDAQIIEACDLGGLSQVQFAKAQGITLTAAKSRLQRARRRLAEHMAKACRVQRDEAGDVCCFVPRPPEHR